MVMRGWQARLKISLEMAHEIVQAAVQHNDKSVQPFFITIPTVVVSPLRAPVLRIPQFGTRRPRGRLPRTVYSPPDCPHSQTARRGPRANPHPRG